MIKLILKWLGLDGVLRERMKLPGGSFTIEVFENAAARLRGDAPIKKLVRNKMTNVGLAVISGLLGNTGSQTAFTFLAVGGSNSAVSASDTTLGSEYSTLGLSRSAATVSRTTTSKTNDTLSLLHVWTVTGSGTIEECGIFNAVSSGIMLARALTGSIAVINTNQIQITYTLQIVGN